MIPRQPDSAVLKQQSPGANSGRVILVDERAAIFQIFAPRSTGRGKFVLTGDNLCNRHS